MTNDVLSGRSALIAFCTGISVRVSADDVAPGQDVGALVVEHGVLALRQRPDEPVPVKGRQVAGSTRDLSQARLHNAGRYQ